MAVKNVGERVRKLKDEDTKEALIPLPCPFCGQNPVIDNYKLRGVMFWRLGCINDSCLVDVETIDFESGEEVITVWNQRAY